MVCLMPRSPIRTVRVSDRLWQAVKATATARGETVSFVILRALRQYTGQLGNTDEEVTTPCLVGPDAEAGSADHGTN